jgi:hypothetical protein
MTSASIALGDCFLVFSFTHQRMECPRLTHSCALVLRDYPIRPGRQSSHNVPGSTESVSLLNKLDIP